MGSIHVLCCLIFAFKITYYWPTYSLHKVEAKYFVKKRQHADIIQEAAKCTNIMVVVVYTIQCTLYTVHY